MGGKVDGVGKKSAAGGLALLGFAGAVAGGFGMAVRSAMSFESGMSGVAAALGGVGTAAGITKETFAALDAEAIRIGSTTTQSATGAAQAMELLAKAGISVEAILDGAAQAAVNLAEATGEQLAQSAESLAAIMNLFEGIDAGRAADIFTSGMNASSATMAEFQTGIARLAPVIASTGMSFEDSAAQIAFFNAKGLGAAEVGTSLTGMFNSVTQPGADAAAMMQELGVSAYDAQGQFLGFPDIFRQLSTATAGMTDEQRDLALGMIFTADSMDVVNMGIDSNMEGYDALRASMDETGTAAEASATRMDNLAGDMEGLRGVIDALSIRIGKFLTPKLRTMTKGVTGALEAILKLPSGVLKVTAVLVVLVAGIAAFAGAMALLATPIAATFLATFGGALAALLSPIALVAAAVIGLAFLFKGPIIDGLSSFGDGLADIGDRLDEFYDDFTKVFDRLREEGQDDTYLGGGMFAPSTVEQVSVASAGIRAFGSALEDLTGIENSAFFSDFAAGADAAAAAISGFVSSIFSGDFSGAMASLGDLGEIVIAGTIRLGGMLADVAGDLWGWIKGQILGTSGVGDGTGGPMGASAGISLGDVAVVGGLRLGGVLADVAGNIWGWVQSRLFGGGSGEAFGSVAGRPETGDPNAFQINLPEILVDIAGWAKGTAWPSLRDFVVTTATAAAGVIGEYAVPIGNVLVDIAGWAKGTAWPSLRDFVVTAATNAAGVIAGFAVPIGNVLVDIAGWAKGVWPSLREFVVTTATGAAGVIAGFAVDIGNVLVDIAGWAKGVWPSLREFAVNTAMSAWGAISGFAVTAGSLLVDLGAWAKGVWPSLREFVTAEAASAWNVIKEFPISLGGWSIDLAAPTVNLLPSELQSWVQAAVDGAGYVKAEVKEWEAILNDPKVTTQGGGPPDDNWLTSLLKKEGFGVGLTRFPVPGILLTVEQWKMVGGTLAAGNDALQKLVSGFLGWRATVPEWALGFPAPTLVMAYGISWVIGQIRQKFNNFTIHHLDWILKVNNPLVSLTFGLVELIKWVKDEVLGLGDVSIDITPNIDVNLPGGGKPPTKFGTSTNAYPTLEEPAFPNYDPSSAAMFEPKMGPVLQVRYKSSPGQDFAAFVANVQSGADQTPIRATVTMDTAALSTAAAVVTSITLAIESRVTAMAMTLTTMGANAGSGFANTFGPAMMAAATQVTTATLAIESRVTAMALTLTTMGLNAGTGFANTFGPAMMTAATQVTTATLAIEARVTAMATTLTNAGLLAGSGFLNTLTPPLNAAVAQAGAVQASFAAIFAGIASAATTLGIAAGQGFNSGIVAGTSSAVAAAGGAAGALTGIFSGVAAAMTNLGIAGGQGFAFGVAGGMAQAVGSAYAGANAIRGALSGIGNMSGVGFGIGASLGQGIAGGIQSQIGAVAYAAASLVSAAVGAARGAGGIASPSKVMRDIVGLPLAQGVAAGMGLGERDVALAARSLIGAGVVGVPPGIGPGGSGGTTARGATTSPQVVQHITYRIDRASFRTGVDWDRQFAERSRAIALSGQQG